MPMNDCPHGQQARTCEICELEAERDRLLAKLAHAQVNTVMANGAADAAAEAVGNMAEKLSTVLAERDRLRAVVEAARAALAVIDSTPVGQMLAGIEGRDEITLLRVRLDQLDVSAEATDG